MEKKLLTLVVILMMIGANVIAQTITGKVTSGADGNTLPGVSIVLKGATAGTTTSEDGKFSIKVPTNGSILVFSAIGFKKQEIATNGRSVINVAMDEDASILDEVVVTALGITKEQRALGYATNTVKAVDITRTGSPNFTTALYSQAAGVRIGTTPGGATSAVNITIRGINSITGRSQPLIILDGVPIRDGEVSNNNYWGDQRLRGNGLLDINPEDIENLSVLKGASAAALYGSEAVNGVVLITTKNGKGKKNSGLGVDFSANYSTDKIAYLPRYQDIRGTGVPLQVSNAGQDAEGFVYYDTNGDGVKETRGVPSINQSFGAKFDGKPIMGWDGVIRPYESQLNNYAGLYQQATNSSVNVAISKATDNSNMRFSLTRQDNQGISLGATNAKNIANLNTSFNISKRWTTDVMVNYVNQKTHNRPVSIDRMINNFTGMMSRFDNADWYLNTNKSSRGYRYVTGTGQSLTPAENIIYNGFKGDIADYVWRLKEQNLDEYSNRVIASMTHKFQITNDLKFRARLSTDFTSEKLETRSTTEKPIAFGYTGGFGLSSNIYNIAYGDALLTYTKKITPDFEVNLMGGYTATKEISTFLGRSTNGGLSTENLFDVAASVNTANSSSTRNSLIKDAFLGTINLDYKGYLFVEGTLRQDRTSTMNPNNNTFIYPSVNTGFVFSDAFKVPSFLSYGKVRASWGVVGNYPSLYSANIAYSQGTLGVQQTGGQPVLFTTIPNAFGNDLIRPEQKHEFEIGLETKFFQNRIGLDISYYNAQIVDQILPLTIAASSGAASVLTNVGTLRNKGLEIGLVATPIKTASLLWETRLNFAKNVNKVEKLANGSSELLHADFDGNAAQLKSVVGQPMGDFYAHPLAFNSSGQKIVSADGLYKLDANTLTKIGNSMPKVTGAFINNFSYKGFSISAMADFRFGGYIMPTGLYWMISRGILEESINAMDTEHGGLSYYIDKNGKGVAATGTQGPNGEKVYTDGMLMDGVLGTGEKNTNIISQAYYYNNTYNWGGPQYSASRYELYIQENSYIKLRELSFGYKIPAAIAQRIGAKNLNLSVFGRNLMFFYRTIKDMDPEQTVAGSRWSQTLTNAGTNPATRTVGVMLRASF